MSYLSEKDVIEIADTVSMRRDIFFDGDIEIRE